MFYAGRRLSKTEKKETEEGNPKKISFFRFVVRI